MLQVKPIYFDTFRCLAGGCPDSCCKEWDVQVDAEKAAFYRNLDGQLGRALRSVLKDEDGETYLVNIGGRCPMWRRDGLCRIQAELGEDALCKTCREYPRLTHDYGDFVEYGLELSCPEAAGIILNTSDPSYTVREIPGGDTPEYDREDMRVLLRSRETARAILSDSARSVGEALALLVAYSGHVQAQLNGVSLPSFDEETALSRCRRFEVSDEYTDLLNFFKHLEILTPEWAKRLEEPSPSDWEERHRQLARYFVDRYWLQAISDYDVVGRGKLVAVSCLMVRLLGGDLLRTAQLYSKEIENSIENVEAILDGMYDDPVFADPQLFGLLLR